MKTKKIFCMIFMLCASFFSVSFAETNNSSGDGFARDGSYTYLDTVDVSAAARVYYVSLVDRFNRTEKEITGIKVMAYFSNGMLYEQVLSVEEIDRCNAEACENCILRIKKGDKAVVRVKVYPREKFISEFIGKIASE